MTQNDLDFGQTCKHKKILNLPSLTETPSPSSLTETPSLCLSDAANILQSEKINLVHNRNLTATGYYTVGRGVTQ